MRDATRLPPVVVICGDEPHQKATILSRVLDELLPPTVDRGFALATYDGTKNEDQGGPTYADVMDELLTLPFVADRRVVLIREADRFVTAYREKLENYLTAPASTGTLILECRTFPKTTRLYKAIEKCRGSVHECRKLSGRALVDVVMEHARARQKRLDPATAARICTLVGADLGRLASEIEKLALFVGDRPTIGPRDVEELVGQTREEKIFAAMDAAGAGRLPEALRLWQQVAGTDPAAAYKAIGGIAFVLRRWLAAQREVQQGQSLRAIAPKFMMWGREDELATILGRHSPCALRRLLAEVAELDSQAKSGGRSIETGVEALLAQVAAPTT